MNRGSFGYINPKGQNDTLNSSINAENYQDGSLLNIISDAKINLTSTDVSSNVSTKNLQIVNSKSESNKEDNEMDRKNEMSKIKKLIPEEILDV